MPTPTRAPSMPESYFRLVRRFPLARIRDDRQLAEACRVMDRLLEEDRDEGEESYLDVLTDLVEAYEARRATIPDASEADVLPLLMTANGFSQSTLSAEAGISQSTLSAILNGKRSLTRGQMITLANRFHVSPAVFLPVVKS